GSSFARGAPLAGPSPLLPPTPLPRPFYPPNTPAHGPSRETRSGRWQGLDWPRLWRDRRSRR
ncbi:MAG: MFS transporter, partial [Planctomycetaceae bacterium]